MSDRDFEDGRLNERAFEQINRDNDLFDSKTDSRSVNRASNMRIQNDDKEPSEVSSSVAWMQEGNQDISAAGMDHRSQP